MLVPLPCVGRHFRAAAICGCGSDEPLPTAPNSRASGSVTNGRWPGDGVFDGIDDKRVAERQNDSQHHNAHSRTRIPPFHSTTRAERQQEREEQDVVAQNRHEPVKERIDQRPVDEQKQARVERLQPVHRRQCSGNWEVEN